MSLQVWLPLNGNLENLGLSDLTFRVVNYNNAISASTSGGKVVSGLYKRTTKETADYITSDKAITLNGDVSMCCWAKVTGVGYAGTANGIFGQHGHLTGGLGITMKDVSSTDLRMSVNTGLYGDNHGSSSDRTYCAYYGATNIYNAWHHLCLTYDSKTKQLRMYVDGKPEIITHNNSYVLTIPGNNVTPRPVILFAWSTDHLGSSINNYRPPCELNDVRVYDHVLSAREVKEIAKGLRLHYLLDSPRFSNACTTADLSIYNNHGVPSSLVATGEQFMGYPVYRLTMTPNSSTLSSFKTELWGHGVYSCNGGSNFTYSANTRYCYWLYYRPVTHGDIRVGGVASNQHGWTEIAPHYFGDGWYRVGQYRDGSVTSAKTDAIYTSIYTPTAAVDTPIVIDFCAPHLCAGVSKIIDSYGAPENSSIEYDVSGYGNNASITGPITSDPTSPRYKNGYFFNSTAYLRSPSLSLSSMSNSYTIAYWAYHSNMDGKMAWGFEDGNRLNIYPASWFNWNTGDGSSNPFVNGSSNVAFTPYNGGWHHYAVTGNGSSSVLYIDGAYRGTAKAFQPITGSRLILSGWNTAGDYKWTNGSIVDFRMYATCFSADDISDLYKTGMSVAKDGTMFAYDFNEFSQNKQSSLAKDGVATACSFSTNVAPTYDMKIKTLDDGSVWARIHHLDVSTTQQFFANAAEVAKCLDKANRYSRMGDIEKYKSSDGKYEFMLTYPRLSQTEYNRWSQTSTPNASSVSGYTPIHIAWSAHSAGIRKHGSANVYDCDSGDTWYAPIGQLSVWEGGIPAADGKMQKETELWVRVDKLAAATQLKIYNGSIIATNFIEM